MLPPRDYPDQSTDAHGSVDVDAVRSPPLTVRTVLERSESKQPVTHDMIHSAVTNLFMVDTYEETHSSSPRPARIVKFPTLGKLRFPFR
jgi:hypothetical protein